MAADGADYASQVTRREFDAVTGGLQRQIDSQQRVLEVGLKEVRDETRRQTDSVVQGMQALSQKVERMATPQPHGELASLIAELRRDLPKQKSGSISWVSLVLLGAFGSVLLLHFLKISF